MTARRVRVPTTVCRLRSAEPVAPDRVDVVFETAEGGADLPLRFRLGDLPALLLQLQQAAEEAVTALGQPDRHRFLAISRLEVLKSADVVTLVLHLGETRVPLALSTEQARSVADALATLTEPADGAPPRPN